MPYLIELENPFLGGSIFNQILIQKLSTGWYWSDYMGHPLGPFASAYEAEESARETYDSGWQRL